MRIIKKINNNVALALAADGTECVVFGKGIGFPVMPYELEGEQAIQRIFAGADDTAIQTMRGISEDVFTASNEIVALAEVALDCELSQNLVLTLADHLQYALDRKERGIVLKNPLAHEISFIYPREVDLGARGIKVVLDNTGIQLPGAEAVSIALHIVNAEIDGMGSTEDMNIVVKSAAIMERVVRIVESELRVSLDHSSYTYARFIAHLRFLIRRLMEDSGGERSENSSLFCQAARDFPEAYRCAEKIDRYFAQEHGWACSNEEVLYLMMHINRLRSSAQKA